MMSIFRTNDGKAGVRPYVWVRVLLINWVEAGGSRVSERKTFARLGNIGPPRAISVLIPVQTFNIQEFQGPKKQTEGNHSVAGGRFKGALPSNQSPKATILSVTRVDRLVGVFKVAAAAAAD